MSSLHTYKYFSNQHQCTGNGDIFPLEYSLLFVSRLNKTEHFLSVCLYSEEHLDQAHVLLRMN